VHDRRSLEPKAGGWLERHVQMILDVANFQTRRDERIRLTESSKFQHEFDIIADSPEGTLLVECKQ